MRDSVQGGALTEVSFFILLALHTPRHGYAVMQFIESATDGRLRLGAGTLYGAINAMCAKGWIVPDDAGAGRQKCYVITPLGRTVAREELTRLCALTETAREIMEDKG